MQNPPGVSKGVLWTGRIMSLLPALVLIGSAIAKFVQPPGFAEGLAHLGWPVSSMVGLGILELTCAILYLVPQTSTLGAILVTGYLGGAIATHVRVGDPYIPQFVLGVLVWGGLYLRDLRLKPLIPLRTNPTF